MGKISAPVSISPDQVTGIFDCGVASLNEWLKRQALKNETTGASRTFVVCDGEQQVVGYYALATGSVIRREAPGKVRRGMPEPVPVLILGRLAVALPWQAAGIGSGLSKDLPTVT